MKKDLIIYTDNIEPEAVNQIYELIRQPPFENAKVRIMPDVHYGKGCVVGFTSTSGDKLIPNVIGVDIGCGMLTVKLGKEKLDLAKLDDYIRNHVPAGAKVHKAYTEEALIKKLRCFPQLENLDKLYRSMGTLGGGNHFIEVDADEAGEQYLVIHTGSRNVGQQVATYYQKRAVELCKNAAREQKQETHSRLLREGKAAQIPDALQEISRKFSELTKIPAQMCYLWGVEKEDYLHDLGICQEFAKRNRQHIAAGILKFLHIAAGESFDTVHNYIDADGIIRKGAIAAHSGQRVIIPMNMRDGCIIAVGKGNPQWNYSAPHGAGRLYSRQAVQELFSLAEYTRQMEGIYSTSVCQATLDESPMAYKPMEEIISLIGPTVEIEKVITPLYNFKAGN